MKKKTRAHSEILFPVNRALNKTDLDSSEIDIANFDIEQPNSPTMLKQSQGWLQFEKNSVKFL